MDLELLQGILSILLILGLAPLFVGMINKQKSKLTGRIGAPIIQPYYELKRLFKKDLWTPFGIRTHSTLEPDFNPKSYHLGSIWPHDNWIIAQGLKNLGRKSEYQKIKNAILLADEKIGYLPEFYGVIDGKITLEMEKIVCHPQAWASGALLNFLRESR